MFSVHLWNSVCLESHIKENEESINFVKFLFDKRSFSAHSRRGTVADVDKDGIGDMLIKIEVTVIAARGNSGGSRKLIFLDNKSE